MNERRDPDRLIQTFVMEGQTELADQVYDAVRATIEHKRQRVTVGPWRMPTMKYVPIGLGVAAVVAVLFVGAQLVGGPSFGGTGAEPTASPEATASPVQTASPEPSPSPPTTAPPMTQSFVSTQHGISLSYPEGWTAQAATEPWTGNTFVLDFGQPHVDWLADPILESSLFLAIASQPIGDATSEEWKAERLANYDDECGTTEPIDIDGAEGVIGAGDSCHVALVTTEGRGYWIQLYTSDDDPIAVAPYDRAWFEELLGTVQLQPEDAAD